MESINNKEILKTALAAFLAIGLFSAAFVGVNNAVFALATSTTESFSPPTDATVVPADNTPADGHLKHEMTIYMSPDQYYEINANAMQPEEAAEIGALYIDDMFGTNIDGMVVEMYFTTWPSNTKMYWHGNVAASQNDMDRENDRQVIGIGYNPIYSFTIDAISGERIDICHNQEFVRFGADNDENVRSAVLELRKNPEDFMKIYAAEPPEQIEEYALAARGYAEKHFINTEVVNVELENTYPASYDFDENGDLIVTALQLIFTSTDNTGREAEVVIMRETKNLSRISTQHNDIIPGYNYEGDVPGLA